jgi:hypothetical protein
MLFKRIINITPKFCKLDYCTTNILTINMPEVVNENTTKVER